MRYINPDSLNKNPAFTNVVVVEGNVKTVYIGGQDATNASGEARAPETRACTAATPSRPESVA